MFTEKNLQSQTRLSKTKRFVFADSAEENGGLVGILNVFMLVNVCVCVCASVCLSMCVCDLEVSGLQPLSVGMHPRNSRGQSLVTSWLPEGVKGHPSPGEPVATPRTYRLASTV